METMERITYDFCTKEVFDLQSHTVHCADGYIEIVNTRTGEHMFSHDLEENPVGVFVEQGVLLLGELHLFAPPLEVCFPMIAGATLQFKLHQADGRLCLCMRNMPDDTHSFSLTQQPVKVAIRDGIVIISRPTERIIF